MGFCNERSYIGEQIWSSAVFFFCETPAVPVSPEAGFRNRDIKAFSLERL